MQIQLLPSGGCGWERSGGSVSGSNANRWRRQQVGGLGDKELGVSLKTVSSLCEANKFTLWKKGR